MKTYPVRKLGRPLPLCLAAIWLACSGCAHYQYFLVQPANLAQPITKKPSRVDNPPLSYQLSEQDHRLIVQIINPTAAPVNLEGNRSYLVAPSGQTHPFNGAVIAPHSYVGMIFPPPPRIYRAYPSFGFGFGFGYPFYRPGGPLWPYGYGFYDPFYYAPDYYVVYPPNYWEWKVGEMRLSLFYQQLNPTNNFEHQFVFDKRKVK